MTEEEKLNAIKEDMQKGNSPFDADEVFNKKMECYPSNAADILEETFKKRHSDLVCGKEPLSPYFDLFSEGYELAETEGEKNYKHLKSLLYCTIRSCNNCGKVNCENFQRQRIDCCGLWVSYKDYIAKLEKENAVLKKKNSDEECLKRLAKKGYIKFCSKANEWHNLQENPTDLPKCEEDEQIIFCVKEWVESIQKYYTHYCLGFYKKAFLNEDVKLFVERSKGYESEHLPKSVLRWQELEKLQKWETE